MKEKTTSAPLELFINCIILKNPVPVDKHTHTTGRSVCVFVFGCTRALCAPEGPDYMSCREMKSQWIDFLTQCTVFPCGHTHVAVGPASTHIIKDTHIHPYSFPSWLVVLLSFFFFYLNNITSWACVWHCVYLCVCASLCVSSTCAFKCVCAPACVSVCVCVLSLGKCFGGSYIFTTLQGFSKNWDTASSCSHVCLKCQRERDKEREGLRWRKTCLTKRLKLEKTIRGCC